MIETPKQVVVLVHGTFATSDTDDGEAWWQRGSYFWQKLESQLPPGVEMVNDRELFKWSGENLESARFEGATSLTEYIQVLAEEGVSAHVVCHSHGGNLMWRAINISHDFGIEDGHSTKSAIKSWTTIGTPFIQIKTHVVSKFYNTIGPLGPREGIGLAVLYLMLSYLVTVMAVHVGEITGSTFFSLSVLVVGTLTIAWSLIKIISHSRKLAMLTIGLGSYVTPVDVMSNAPRFTWKGIVSDYDEAVAGLKAADSFTPVFPVSHRFSFKLYSAEGRANQTVQNKPNFLWALMRQKLYAFLPGLINRATKKIAFGIDYDPYPTVRISETPLSCFPEPYRLSEKTNEELLAMADEHLSKITPKIRRGLAYASMTGNRDVLKALREIDQTGKELVHSCYFHNDTVIRLVAEHIKKHA